MADIADLALETAGADLVRRLGGIWRHDRGMCLCPAHADREPSLSVRVGRSRLLFHCFAGCDTRNVLRGIARLRPEALACFRHGSNTGPDDPLAGWRRNRLIDLWDTARSTGNTVADCYLARRAINIASPSLRFQPRTPLGSGRALRFRPALLAAVTEGSRLAALQRTFLDPPGVRARDLGNPRRLFGHPGSGVVRLAAANDDLGLAEGLETALSAMILLGLPVWVVLGSARLAKVAIPDTVRHLVLLPDNDPPGRRGAALARVAHAAPDRTIETLWPWHGLNDWNDVLRARRRGGLEGQRQAA